MRIPASCVEALDARDDSLDARYDMNVPGGMLRYKLVAMMLLALPCHAAEAPVATDASHGLPPATCKPPDMPSYALLESDTSNALTAARQPIADFQTSADGFTGCLAQALSLLREDWRSAKREPNQTVEQAVSNAIAVWERYKHLFVGRFNWQVQQYLKAHATDGDVPVAYLHLTPPPAFGAPLPVPANSARLSMPSYGVLGTADCDYPDMSRRKGESGRVIIDYDIGADGALQNVRVVQSSGYDRLDNSAMACVQQRSFMPAIANGEPIASIGYRVQINFSFQ